MTVYSMGKRGQHCQLQATSFMSNFNDFNFPVTAANWISPVGSHLNSIGWFNNKMTTRKYTSTVFKQEFFVSRTKSRPIAPWFISKTQQPSTAASLDRHCEHVRKKVCDHEVSSHVEISNQWYWRSKICPWELGSRLWGHQHCLHVRTWQVLKKVSTVL
jgi:hypothetical protein